MKDFQRKLTLGAVLVLLATLLMSLTFAFVSLKSNLEEGREKHLRAATKLVESAITKEFIQPLTVARVMSEDVHLKESLKQAGTNPTGVEQDMAKYLRSLRNGMGYKIMFVVCHQSGAYYTYDGITTYIDKNYQGNSQWYGAFLQSGRKSQLDVDIEQSTDWALSVFVNRLVLDEKKNVLGVCGTGIEMNRLQSLLQLYERVHQVKVDVVDKNGLIQIDTDVAKIEKESVPLPEADLADGEYYYEKRPEGDRVITYMEGIDLYLVVENKQSLADNLLTELRPALICTCTGVVLALVLLCLAERRRKQL